MDALQEKMSAALVYDQKKTQTNDAKLRAVAQREDYDTFCKMVAGAHLKPVKPCSKESAEISKPFDFFVLPKYEGAASTPAGPAPPPATEPFVPPADADEFERVWRRKCKGVEAKLAYLRAIEPATLPQLFRTEIDSAVLDGFAAALHLAVLGDGAPADGAPDADAVHTWAGGVLLHLSKVNRLGLTLSLADDETTERLAQVLGALAQSAPVVGADGEARRLDVSALAELRRTYSAPL